MVWNSGFQQQVACVVDKKSAKNQQIQQTNGPQLVTLLSTFLVTYISLTHNLGQTPTTNHLQNKTTMTTTPETKPPTTQMADSTRKRGSNRQP
jgi:hypothetical protein